MSVLLLQERATAPSPQSRAADNTNPPAKPDEDPVITFGVELEYFLVVPDPPLLEFERTRRQIAAELEEALRREDRTLDRTLQALPVAGDPELQVAATLESRARKKLLRRQLPWLYGWRGRLLQYAAKLLTSRSILSDGVHICFSRKKATEYSQWNLVDDRSLKTSDNEAALMRKRSLELANGSINTLNAELVSPIFRVAEPSVWYPQIASVQSAMAGKAFTNRTTGLHVHLGLENASISEDVIRLLLLVWAAAEPAIESVHRKHRHGAKQAHAQSLLKQTRKELKVDMAKRCSLQTLVGTETAEPSREALLDAFDRKLDNATTEQILHFGRDLNGGYRGKVYISNPRWRKRTRVEIATAVHEMEARGLRRTPAEREKTTESVVRKRRTIEFREHAGSLDPQTIACWVRFCAHMLRFVMREAAEPVKTRTLKQVMAFTSTLEQLCETIGVSSEDQQYFYQRRREAAEADLAFERLKELVPSATWIVPV